MFEIFGNFNSFEEINLSAEGLLRENDIEGLKTLARENGLDEMDVDDYMDAVAEELCTLNMAAFGKLKVEKAELKPCEIFIDWIEYIKGRCLEEERVARAVRRSDKSLKGCIAHLLEWSFKNQYDVDKDIIAAAGIKSAGKVTLGIPGSGTAKKLILEYYLGK